MRGRPARRVQRAVAFLLGLSILGALLYRVGWVALMTAIRAADGLGLAVSLAFFAPQVALMARRWQLIGSTVRRLSFGQSCRMVLAASALNVVLPSKLGDLCKGLMLGDADGRHVAPGLGLAVLDKLLDIAGLAAVLAAAGMFAPMPERWVRLCWGGSASGLAVLLVLMHLGRSVTPPRQRALAALAQGINAALTVRRDHRRWTAVLGISALLWACHIGQIFVFYRAVGGIAPTAAVWSRVPVAIFIGLLPVTVAGIGTRDVALVVLLRAWDPYSVLVWLGLFCTFRYGVMALLGVPAVMGLGGMAAVESARDARDCVQTE
jgi:uncharacterized membrane protein YbhN (UPF0104 family)